MTTAPPDSAALREEICRVGQSLFERGYAHATAGNISARVRGGYLITPTDACLGRLQPDELALVADDGRQMGGLRASKTLQLHRSIYAADTAARCVIHTHSTHLVALTLVGVWHVDDILPAITPYQVMKVGRVPLVPYHRPGDPRVPPWVAAAIATRATQGSVLRAVMLDRLGPVVWARTTAEASVVLEELEATAQLWLLAGRAVDPLTPVQLNDLRETFGAVW